MNQILMNNSDNDRTLYKNKLQKNIKYSFKYIFIFSLFFIFILLSFYIYHLLRINENKKNSNKIAYNYKTLKLYNNNDFSNEYQNLNSQIYYTEKFVIGEIKIPVINISYPIFSMLDDETLKTSPCIFYGKMPPEKGNLCIAGHNYNNNLFFSNISKLKKEDKIYIYDNQNHEYIYSVFANYEVKTDNLSPLSNSFSNELTLITCNNLNNHRIIIKAKY